jgi:enterochelin esterase-like enzyme
MEKESVLDIQTFEIQSNLLQRSVRFECFLPDSVVNQSSADLLLINDGQDMEELGLASLLEEMISENRVSPLLCVAIHAGERKMEYGTAGTLDYMGRGFRAGLYSRFILEELLPLIRSTYGISSFRQKSFAGFSLGGLSALDIVWNHPHEFSRVGVFSGSLWWRTRGLDDGYNEATDRIMHDMIRNGVYTPELKFFFEAGTLDETMDRNHNGIIDSIDDTLSLIEELVNKGYSRDQDITYLELENGRHDVATWAQAMPVFLKWIG